MVSLTEAERSFYEQILAKARPARTALLKEDAANQAPASIAGSPGSPCGLRWLACAIHTQKCKSVTHSIESQVEHTPWGENAFNMPFLWIASVHWPHSENTMASLSYCTESY